MAESAPAAPGQPAMRIVVTVIIGLVVVAIPLQFRQAAA
jgi:hypothetical protein